jgi:hypothetical protein
MTATEWKIRLDDETGAPMHDTSDPLGCCARCAAAEIGRRSTRRPALRYSRTAASGEVVVLRGSTLVATLVLDRPYGWHARPAAEFRDLLGAIAGETWDATRREVLDDVCAAYTAAWKRGEVR